MSTLTLNQIETSILQWNDSRSSSETLIELLSKGHYFHITKVMHDFWLDKYPGGTPDYIHAYLGVNPDSEMEFFLIDSISDADPEAIIPSNIIQVPYRYGFDEIQIIPPFSANGVPNMNVGILAGLERSFRWNLNRKNWIEDTIAGGTSETSGIFQAIHIPFSDLTSIFTEGDAEKAVVVFGLDTENKVELLSWSEDFSIREDAEDVAHPIPPLKNVDNYNLLKVALGL
jgi:hypothetical protein